MRGKETLWKQTTKLPLLILFMAVFLWGGVPRVNAADAFTGEATQLPTITITPYIDNEEYTWQYLPLEIDSKHTLSVQAVASDGSTPTYVWKDKDGKPIESESTNALEITKGIGNESYSVEVTTKSGGFESCSFFLYPEETLQVTQWIGEEQTTSVSCQPGQSVTLEVDANSTYDNNNIKYQWYAEDLGHPIKHAKESKYTLQKHNKGREIYYCEINDGNYIFVAYFEVRLKDTLSVMQYVNGSPYYEFTTMECKENEVCHLEVSATSTIEGADIKYRWSYSGLDGSYDLDGDGPTYDFKVEEGEWQVKCLIDDGNDSMLYSFRLRTENSLSGEQYINDRKGSYGRFVRGEPIEMEVRVNSSLNDTLTYQWYQGYWCDDSTIMNGEQNSSLNIEKGEDTESQYICKVSDGVFTREYRFNISSINTLRLTGYVNDDVDNDDMYYFAPEEVVTLRVTANSSYENEQLEYQWYEETEEGRVDLTPEDGSPNVCKVKKGGGTDYYRCMVSDGNTQGVYYFNLYEEKDGGTFICIPYIDGVRYDSGMGEEQYVYKYDCKIGQTLTLRAEVLAGGEDVISRQWEVYDDQNGWTSLGEKEETITVKIDSNSTKEYRCKVTCGNKTGALYYNLTAQDEEEPGDNGELQVISYVNGKQSSEIEGKIGEKVNLSLEVINAPENITYQWYKKEDMDTADVILKGETGTEYIHTIQKGIGSISCGIYSNGKQIHSMIFDVRVTGESQNTLTVNEYSINGQPTDKLECKPGQEVTLKVNATSTTGNDISYTWYREGGVKLGGGDSYAFSQTQYQNIYCLISDGVSDVYQWFELDIDYYDWFVSQYIDGEKTNEAIRKEGTPVKLEVKADGENADKLTYQWFNNKNNILGTESDLSVETGAKEETYKCKVSDGYQTEVYWFYLKPEGDIIVTPRINGEKADEITLDVGDTAELKVDVSGTTDGITYQWYVSKDESAFRPLGTSAVQRVIGDNSYAAYLCVVRVGTIEEKVYFYTYYEGDAGEHVHVWNDGVITKEPTQTETGIKTYTCLTCGETKEEILDKLPPTTEDIKPSNPTTGTKPSTQPSQQTPSAQQPQTPSASASSPAPAIGATLVASDKKTVYKVTGSNTVEYKKAGANKAKVTIPSTVTYQGRKYQVTSIGTKAFKNNKKLKKVVIPSTVRKIGKQAFINCKKLKSITIKTNKLNAKAIGSKAFKGINAKATIKVPKKKLKLYKKILRAKGVSASVRIK